MRCDIKFGATILPVCSPQKTEAHKMVPRSVQVVDRDMENSNKSFANQRFIPYQVQKANESP